MAVTVDGDLGVREVVEVARRHEPAELADQARAAMRRTRAVVEEISSADDRPVYGVNTGFGDLYDVAIPQDRQLALQENLLEANTTVGTPLPVDEVRAGLLARAAVLAAGHSGARPVVVDRMLECLNEGVHPIVGSYGNSDDFGANARFGAALTGKGEVMYEGRRLPASEGLAAAGIDLLELREKEGLSVMDGPGLMTGRLALAVFDAYHLLMAADVAGAATFAHVGTQPSAFSPRIVSIRPHPGDGVSAGVVRELLDLDTTSFSTTTQDPLSIRTIPQIHGTARAQLRSATSVVETELGGFGDNPAVFADGEVLSCGGFNGQHVSLAADALSRAIIKLGHASERRTHLYMQGRGDSPPFAAEDPGVDSGLVRAHYSAASLVRESETLATASERSSVVSAGQEDVQSLGTIATGHLLEVVDKIRSALAIELLAAVEVRSIADTRVPAPLDTVLDVVERDLPDRDRSAQIGAIAETISSGATTEAVRDAGVELPSGPPAAAEGPPS